MNAKYKKAMNDLIDYLTDHSYFDWTKSISEHESANRLLRLLVEVGLIERLEYAGGQVSWKPREMNEHDIDDKIEHWRQEAAKTGDELVREKMLRSIYYNALVRIKSFAQANSPISEIVAKALNHSGRHPEDICDACGKPNAVWFTTSLLWNKVVRQSGNRDPMLCPGCFIARAEAMGVPGIWKVNLE